MTYKLTPEKKETLETYNLLANQWNDMSPPHWKDEIWAHFISNMKGDLILDLGCGTARDADLCIDDGLKYVGIDLSEPMLRVGTRDFAREIQEERISLLCMNMYELAFRSECFHAFRSVTSFMHIPRPNLILVLREVYRVLMPQGIGFISVPCGTSNDMYKSSYHAGKTLSVCWLPDELRGLLEMARFTVMWHEVFDFMLLCVVQKS